ncbi:MAG TPA: hypothetical protein VG222_09950 [Vicinamibacterales bacterium]|nr:hypothetical protein [Vicinamibacterales bacterium]
MLLRRAVDRLTLVVLGTAIVLLLAWLLFHPLVVAALQGALVIVAAAWRVRLVRRAS